MAHGELPQDVSSIGWPIPFENPANRRQGPTVTTPPSSYGGHRIRNPGGTMALFTMKLENLEQLFLQELRDLYDAEDQITEALPKMIEAAHYPELKNALQEHLEITRQQIQRLDQVFDILGEDASGQTCKGMKGVIKEGDEIISQGGDGATVDAGIISAAQRVEHYEMAGYGTVRTYAELLGQQQIASLLQQTLDEEKEADEKLTEIARSVNTEAKAA